MTREELLALAARHRDNPAIGILLGGYHIAYVELMTTLHRLSTMTSRAITTLDHTASTTATPAVDDLPTTAIEAVKRAARIDEILFDLAAILEKLGEPVNW
jgi:hypothetical protein